MSQTALYTREFQWMHYCLFLASLLWYWFWILACLGDNCLSKWLLCYYGAFCFALQEISLAIIKQQLVFNFDSHEKLWVCLMVSWLASWLPREVSKTSVLPFSGINVMNIRLCLVVLYFGHSWFMPLSVTKAIIQGHSGVIFYFNENFMFLCN